VHSLKAEDSVLVEPRAIRDVRVPTRSAGYLVVMFEATSVIGLERAQNRVLGLPGEARDDMHALAAEVRRPGGPDSRILAQALATRILIALCRQVRNDVQQPAVSNLNADGHAQVVAHAEAFMLRNIGRTLRRADIAAAVNLSEPHLARLFRSVLGKSVMDRLAELRMEHAQVLLLESTMSVTQIAGVVGITSFSYFSKAFRAATSMTPSDYRKSGGRVYS
jgi:AraC-like DNA-binding protein